MFKLNFTIPDSKKKISHDDKIYLTGSCFSDEIGSKFKHYKFDVLSNPFGTIYNPVSILKTIDGNIHIENLVENQDVTYHWDTHGSIAGINKSQTIDKLEATLDESQTFLKATNWLIITFGTAWVYELKKSGKIVANCHKVPSSEFDKRLLSQNEIVNAFSKTIEHLNIIKTNLKIVLTLSPVRHIRDGLVENNQSKAILLSSIHDIKDRYDQVEYFPSYEIVIDELRDYRFYSEDMVHPSNQAIDYIWKAFGATYFDQETLALLSNLEKVKKSLHHSPFNQKSVTHQKFLVSTLEKLEELNEKVDLTVEIQTIKSQLQ